MMDNSPASTVQMLDGLSVLDFTRVLAGPHCTRLLADLGAEVIKVERPGEGDEMRRAPQRLAGEGDQSTYFVRRNAGKKSIAIDLGRAEGIKLVHALLPGIDVVVENFMPGVAARLGIAYEQLSAIKPDLVYCSISGYGQTGPMAQQGAFAHVVAAASGVMYQDAVAGTPTSSHSQAADALAGTNGFGAVMAALWRRERTGQGAHVDVSMLESLIASEDISFGSVPNGYEPMPTGQRVGMGLSQVHGRWIAWQSGGAPSLWPRLCAAMGREELLNDPRFSTPDARREHWSTMQGIVSDWLQGSTDVHAALSALKDARVPCALVRSVEEVVACEQLQARQTFSEVTHPAEMSVKVTSSPYWIDGAPVSARGSAPYRIGEHTRAVLAERLGYSVAQIDSLAHAGVVATPPDT